MSAEELEAHAKKLLKHKLKGLSEDEQAELISKKLSEVAKKQQRDK